MQQCLVVKRLRATAHQPVRLGEAGAGDGADALVRQRIHPPPQRPRWLAGHHGSVEPGQCIVEGGLLRAQMKVELRELGHQAFEARNHPAGQQADRTAEHERRMSGARTQRFAGVAQLGERRSTGVAQALAGRGQHQAAPLPLEQRRVKVFFQRANVTTDGAVGHVQFRGGAAHATQAGGGFEGEQGVQRGQRAGHGTCEFS